MASSYQPDGLQGIDPLVDFIERRPELVALKVQADSVKAQYLPNEAKQEDRIKVPSDLVLNIKKQNVLSFLLSNIWVPVTSMRGKSYATPSLDGSVNATSKVMSISTLWDFFCTLPVFQIALWGPLRALSWPGAILLSLIILYASNAAGTKATDRRDSHHKSTATLSLFAFLLLSLVKTAFSGVGIDLWVGSRDIASNYAYQLATSKLADDKKQLAELQQPKADLVAATNECNQLVDRLQQVNRSVNERMFQSLYVLAYGSKVAESSNAGLSTDQIIDKYGSISKVPGACNQEKILREVAQKDSDLLAESLSERSLKVNAIAPLDYLQEYEPDLFNQHFFQDDKKWGWKSQTNAVAQATDQFWQKLLKGQFGQLGFSLMFLLISLILTVTATLLIYQLSLNPKVKASFSDRLRDELGKRLSAYAQLADQSLSSVPSGLSNTEAESASPEASSHQEGEILSGDDTQVRSLKYLKGYAQTAQDRRLADALYKKLLVDLWAQHVALSGETYYSPLSEDLYEIYTLEEQAS
ncbi:MAG: hypothetical protein CMM03_03655 [Rhodopirellula sp.]|nr:hypothetical protein [Rhodopirellula sp.]|tara:strand:+ start:377 stop:1957 length:1581 start_codon:yes stop_codon:yes gene_type:complete